MAANNAVSRATSRTSVGVDVQTQVVVGFRSIIYAIREGVGSGTMGRIGCEGLYVGVVESLIDVGGSVSTNGSDGTDDGC